MEVKAAVRLKEIAEATNLSVATVSRVLRHKGEVSDNTRARVFKAAKEMRYRPNFLVKGIQTGKTCTMGVIVPPYDSFWTEVLCGIQGSLAEANHFFINTWCRHEDNEANYSRQLLEQLHGLMDRRVDGIILWAHLAPLYTEHVDELKLGHLPVVTIDHRLSFADSVETDEGELAFLAADYLLGKGHRHIGQLAWQSSYNWAQLRRRNFEQRVGQCADANCRTVEAATIDEVPKRFFELLEAEPGLTAVFACSDHVARKIYEAAEEMGLRIPDDISVLGAAALDFSAWMRPGLTTIRQRGLEMGRRAAEIVMDRSLGTLDDEGPQRITVGCELVERESVRDCR